MGLGSRCGKKTVISYLGVGWGSERSKKKSMNHRKEITFVLRVCNGSNFLAGPLSPYGYWSFVGCQTWVGGAREGFYWSVL